MKTMAIVLLLSLPFAVFQLFAQVTVVDLSKNPMETDPARWTSGGDAQWGICRSGSKYCLFSGQIGDKQSCWVDFEVETSSGYFEFDYLISTESPDKMIFRCNNYEVTYSGGEKEWKPYKLFVDQGRHSARWKYIKDSSHAGGRDTVYIKNIRYPTPLAPLSTTVSYTDAKTHGSWGNGDLVIDTFEVVQIAGNFSNNRKQEKVLTIVPQLPTGIVLLSSPQITDLPDQTEARWSFSIVAGEEFKNPTLKFSILFRTTSGEIFSKDFEAAFRRTNMARKYLEDEKIIATEKFDYRDKSQLDKFLALFPNDEIAPVLFRLRLECCRAVRAEVLGKIAQQTLSPEERERELIRAVNEYNEFIAAYPDRLLSRVAIHECFDLYSRVNRISFYQNFMDRYPNSEHSIVAAEHIKFLLYQVICTQNSVQSYEKFLALYPQPSFYRDKCIQLAVDKALAEERLIAETLNTPEERNKRANLLAKEIYDIRARYKNLSPEERMQKIISDTSINRFKKIISEIYSDTYAIQTLLVLEDLYDIKEMQQQLRQVMELQQQQTLQVLKDNFKQLDESLDRNFGEIKQQLTEVKSHLQKIESDIAWMHRDLNNRFDQVEEHLKKIDADVQKLDADMQRGFAKIETKLDTGFAQIDKHLQLLHGDLGKINDTILHVESSIVKTSEDNRRFIQRQCGEMIDKIEENGKIYAGYQTMQRPSFQKAASNTISNLLAAGVQSIPLVGPLAAHAGAPVLDWLGENATNAAIDVWHSIF